MSLPTNGMPRTIQSPVSNVFIPSSQTPGMPSPLSFMGIHGIPAMVHHPHQFMLRNQSGMIRMPSGIMATSAEAMAIMSSTASNAHLGSFGPLSEQGNFQLPSEGHTENGHSLSISPHQIPDSSSNSIGTPYGNIQVKQEMGPSGMPMPSHRAAVSCQFSQLSSPESQSSGSMSNPFSVNNGMPSPKHICAVCGDRASGKHYGVYSCEGCKGFFKRTVRKFLTYTCRDDKQCVIDKRQRNRCQYCRYQKCLTTGMKKEAVQEERQRNKDQDESQSDQSPVDDMPVDKIYQAEISSDQSPEELKTASDSLESDAVVCKAADHQLYTLVGWAKKLPFFAALPLDDQVTLLRAGWNELLIASFSHRSTEIPDGIILASGLRVYRQSAHTAGVGGIFDRVLTELIAKMRDMRMDRTELGCLRAIVLFNPDIKDLTDAAFIETLREKVYASLEVYCKTKYPEQSGRFAKLLLRLPALRSIGLKCLEHLFFFKLIGSTPIDQFLMEKLTSDKSSEDSDCNSRPTSTVSGDNASSVVTSL